MKIRWLFCLILFLSLQTAWAGTKLEPCKIDGVEGETRCGFVDVLENRDLLQGRKIQVYVVVLSALTPEPAPDPLWVIQGGPGQAGTKLADFYATAFAEVRKKRDIVLFDQRGTGKSNGLKCELADGSNGPGGYLVDLLPIEKVKECKSHLEKTVDLAQYTTLNGMRDLDEIRAQLGYEKINLYGTSYGTAAATVYMQQYSEHVRTAVLKAVAPIQTMRLSVTTAADSQRALDRVFRDCAADEACNRAFPDLQKEFDSLMERLRKEPAEVEVMDPQSKKTTTVALRAADLILTLRAMLHAPDAQAKLPMLIHQAATGNLAPVTEIAIQLHKSFQEELSFGMFLTIYCTEEIPFVTEEMIRKETANTFHGDYWVRQIMNACTMWPKGEVPDRSSKPAVSRAPVLLISGGLDPVTPPKWGEEVAKSLPNSRHFVIPNGGHSFNRMQGCVDVVIADFIAKGSVETLDFSCAAKITRPQFAIQ
ncbi:alpha/beta fold hydrolase [bacterium]|nr:alpha/beta fold hydrolase [bacterium]